MKKIKHLHILHYTRFTIPFINFINNTFHREEHFFIIYRGKSFDSFKCAGNNIWKGKNITDLIYIAKKMNTSSNIYLHSMMTHKIPLLLFFQPWLLKRTDWIIWGADLHFYSDHPKGLYFTLYEHIRKTVIKHLRGIISHTPADYSLAKEFYDTRAVFKECIYYPSAFPFNIMNIKSEPKPHDTVNIMVGNSASHANNHIQVFERLKKIEYPVHIFSPLSYGDQDYAMEVIHAGENAFQERFHPMTEYMALEDYYSFLGSIDIAVFDLNRQQGLGNIITLLYLEKKLFIRVPSSLSDLLDRKGFTYFNIDKIETELFKELSDEDVKKNHTIAKEKFSMSQAIKDWSNIFLNNS